MSKNKIQKRINWNSFSHLKPLFAPYKKEVMQAALALLVTAAMILFFGRSIKCMIDFGFSKNDEHLLNLSLITFIIGVIIMALAGYYRSYLVNSIAEKVIADLRKKVYTHILRVSTEFFEVTKTNDVVSRLTVDSALLYETISSTSSFLLRNSLFFFGGIILLLCTSIKLTLLTLGLIPLAIAPIIILGKHIKKFSNQTQIAAAKTGAQIEETINGLKTIQSYLCENKEARKFSDLSDQYLITSLHRIRLRSLTIALVIAAAFGAIAIVLWIGGHDVLNHKMSAGELSSFIFYSIITAVSLVSISQIMGQLQSSSAAAARIFELLEIESPVKESKMPEIFTRSDKINISFNNVDFSYPNQFQQKVLKNFNLTINAGEKIAIVGSSGSGKSTILQLLLRFYDVNSGSITINNQNISNLTLADLRHCFSYISQDCFIFSGTIFENIAYADNNITRNQVEKLIEQNPSLHFINNFVDKMDSFVGEKGGKLSGGEKQRIAIARAILKDSDVLLLDEATSALDNQNEKIINDLISNLASNKTVITVAHRLSSIINSDRIIFVKDGAIAEMGSHQELIHQNGLYKKMYEAEEFLK